jgi:hypothetical protein
MFNVIRSTVQGAFRLVMMHGVLVAPVVVAQSASGPVVFPVVTETNVTDCRASEGPLLGPSGGTVQLQGGQFINRGDTIYVTGTGSSCSNGLTIRFSPAATDVTIAVRTFIGSANDEILLGVSEPSGVTSTQYTVQPQGTVLLHAQGEIASVSIRSVRTGIPLNFWGFGISSLAITQAPINNSEVTFDAASGPDDSKILISRAVWDVGYPSRFQLVPDGAGNPRIKIAGTLRDRFSGQGTSGPVFLRVEDPPDPAPYRGADSHSGDNDGGAASFNGSATAALQADAQGRFETELVVSSTTAGDNYVVVGSTNAQFGCGGTPCPRSPVFTLWKRIYVEEQQMFRRGTFVSDEVIPGTFEIPVHEEKPFQRLAAGQMLQLVHAESGLGEGFYSDRVVFQSLQRKGDGSWVIRTAPSTPISRMYGAKPVTIPNPNPNAPPASSPIMDVIRDGVGVISAGTFKTNPNYAGPLFDSMFVELMPINSTVTEVPYLAELYDPLLNAYFASRWLQQGVRKNQYGSRPDPNVFHRIAARQAKLVPKGSCSGAELGITCVGGGGNYSYIFDQRIQDLTTGVVMDPAAGCPPVAAYYRNAPTSTVNGETTAHETVHLWVRTMRQPDLDLQGHCSKHRYVDAMNCLMHTPYAGPGLSDGQVLLHYDTNGAHSEYMWIRRDPDPVPQQ